MEPIRYADGLNERNIPFSLFRSALHRNNLSVSLGWEKTIEKLTEYLASDLTSRQYAQGLRDLYLDLTLAGNKLVRIFKVDGDFDALCDFFVDEVLEAVTPYDDAFPLPLEHAQLAQVPVGIRCVNYYSERADEVYATLDVVFCSKQFVTEKEELPADALTAEVVEDYGQFDVVYGVKSRALQLFDVVHLDRETKTLQIRMDGLNSQRYKDVQHRLEVLTDRIVNHIEEHFPAQDMISGPVNFFPCIKTLYAAKDGRISEIGHTTESAGVHKGKVRTKHYDFRKDEYHVGGVAEIGDINPHMLAKFWPSPSRDGIVELVIPGTIAVSSSANPTIDSVLVLSCASESDYDFVMEKLFQALA